MSIPSAYQQMKQSNPKMLEAYEALGAACAASGPLDARTIPLVKLGMSLAAGLEGAAHSHARKALEAGCTEAELLHVANLSAPTIGWPSMMRAREWVTDVTQAASKRAKA
jgi:alkylhydroperoxidase/carboxymuconolactone decarboxylase family protein YurZ